MCVYTCGVHMLACMGPTGAQMEVRLLADSILAIHILWILSSERTIACFYPLAYLFILSCFFLVLGTPGTPEYSARSLLPSHAPRSHWRECTEGRGPFSFCFSHPDHPTPTSGLLPTCSGLTHPPSSFSCPLTCETRRAEAEECSGEIKAAGSHWAGVTQTFIHFCLTVWPFKACGRGVGQGSHRWSPLLATEPQFTWETLAVEGSRLVLAVPPIGTGGADTLVHVFLTSGASESWWGRGWDGKGVCSRTSREAQGEQRWVF